MLKNKVAFVLFLSMCLMLFAGCGNEPKTLIDTDSLKVVREGAKTTVYDILGDEQYNFKTVRVKRSEGVSEPSTAISTDTISIDILPHGVLKITDKTVEKVYIIKPSGRG